MRRLVFLVPGDPASLTGGYGYDRAIVAGLRERGWSIAMPALAASFPWPDAPALNAAAKDVAAIDNGTLVVADGLAFGALPALTEQHAARLRWVALVHHPLALETGLDDAARRQLADSERRALASARIVIVPSAATARALAPYGVPAARIRIVPPGTAPASLATGSGAGAVAGLNLLCVATLSARKGHALLIEALAGLADRAWTLHCIGSTTRDRATADSLRGLIHAHGLAHRVHLLGELPPADLQTHYSQADIAVLASYFEGYGMALAEALAHGLPVIATTAGAIPDTVPPAAGMLVPPGDAAALRAALRRVFDEPALRAQLAAGARAARAMLPAWPQAVAAFEAALDDAGSLPR
ncbi:glycosyltransferase family 4 protein [Aquincola sp. S2]|uniref:Glycosyltransferase family 4 protein n=1 Tax=Pseudaquabacterium terrae TaxID=2732868 RepID=A0ABX2EA17_9BURK|nr:glycosyltransferase family 4 protein [Aquabacterium terrae]NRF65371.1 glycosyltransferase family 4 protein [Aquabacterium terrae]